MSLEQTTVVITAEGQSDLNLPAGHYFKKTNRTGVAHTTVWTDHRDNFLTYTNRRGETRDITAVEFHKFYAQGYNALNARTPLSPLSAPEMDVLNALTELMQAKPSPAKLAAMNELLLPAGDPNTERFLNTPMPDWAAADNRLGITVADGLTDEEILEHIMRQAGGEDAYLNGEDHNGDVFA